MHIPMRSRSIRKVQPRVPISLLVAHTHTHHGNCTLYKPNFFAQTTSLSLLLNRGMHIRVQLKHLLLTQLPTVAGLSLAAKYNHWFPRVFWIVVSSIGSAACLYCMSAAWSLYQLHDTNVKISVKAVHNYYLIYNKA